jgi:NADPH:quinone reductase-like Zn-dependent oxidoreductase
MKAIFLVRNGAPEKAFEFRETEMPKIKDDQILVKTEGFGLNFADIVAREGMYRDAPPKPCVLGYDVVGEITACGVKVKNLKTGDRVAALTRFGGYAEYAVTDAQAAVSIPATVSIPVASALATQFCTAYYCAAVAANLREGEKVIIHSAAGGVGTALLQYSKFKKCEIFATTGSPSKVDFLKQQGATHVINIAKENFYETINKLTNGEGVDVIFDALGGSYVNKGIKLLAPAGRIVCYGASQMTGTNAFNRLKAALQFGFYHPAQLMMNSKSLLGVNMLHIADKRPEIIQHCLHQVMKLFSEGIFSPLEGKLFPASEIAAAHRCLQDRKAIGKVALSWK